MMTFHLFQSLVNRWSDYNFPKAEAWEPLVGACEELGELCHAYLKQHQGIRGTRAEHMVAKSDAVGDVLVYLAHYGKLNNLNLAECASSAWNEIKDRDWQKFPKNGRTE